MHASKNIEFLIDTKSSNYFSHVGKNLFYIFFTVLLT